MFWSMRGEGTMVIFSVNGSSLCRAYYLHFFGQNCFNDFASKWNAKDAFRALAKWVGHARLMLRHATDLCGD
jgi:hypothetical protein